MQQSGNHSCFIKKWNGVSRKPPWKVAVFKNEEQKFFLPQRICSYVYIFMIQLSLSSMVRAASHVDVIDF
jgi:hypothetical protein